MGIVDKMLDKMLGSELPEHTHPVRCHKCNEIIGYTDPDTLSPIDLFSGTIRQMYVPLIVCKSCESEIKQGGEIIPALKTIEQNKKGEI
jgi:hypothetical protein